MVIIPALPSNCTHCCLEQHHLQFTHYIEVGFAMAGWKRWEAASSHRGCCLAGTYFLQTQQPHRRTVINHIVKDRALLFGGNFQLAWKWTPEFLFSTLALPKVFENNLLPDYGEIILLLQEKERREKRKHCNLQATSALIAVWSQINAEGLTATSVNFELKGLFNLARRSYFSPNYLKKKNWQLN